MTDKKVSSAKPSDKVTKLFDGEGLYLVITPAGTKSWCMKYRFAGKEKKLTFGKYPAMSLADARQSRMKAKLTLAEGIDPSLVKNTKHATTFRDDILEWLRSKESTLTPVTIKKERERLENHVFPFIGHMASVNVTEDHVLTFGKAIETKGKSETAKRCINLVARFFDWLRVNRKATHNPARGLSKAIAEKKTKNNPYLKESQIADFMAALRDYRGHPVTRLAALMLIHSLTRTSEVRFARWEEIDERRNVWRIPAERMKMRSDHVVPITKQMQRFLNEARAYSDGGGYIFPANTKEGVISSNAVLYVIKSLGYKGQVTGHGFRSTASTVLNEHGFNPDAIERQLAHDSKSSVRAMYNHAQYLGERAVMMQWWGDFLEGAKDGESPHLPD